ncbi:MAG: hypothetical protein ABI413_15555 [Ktedonobacteraceae bacterium]
MKPDISANQPAPTPRTEPLIIDRLTPGRLQKVQVYVEGHGGTWIMLADGGYQITFPPGTQQRLDNRNEQTETYIIQFPDGAWITWDRTGRISPVNGLPQKMSNSISVPFE